jgi:hypothetical protein
MTKIREAISSSLLSESATPAVPRNLPQDPSCLAVAGAVAKATV